MKRADEGAFDPLLDSIVGGEPVDWPGAEARAAGGDRSRLRALRDVARVADFHRLLQRDAVSAAGAREVARWGDLLLLERVGRGASGDVHRAWDPALQREVAVKLLRPRGGAGPRTGDLLEEARALARVRHPHVVAIYGAAERDGQVGMWMEFLHGRTLHDTIAERGALPPAEVARLGRELGRALAAVHAAGTLHRDIKPANVMLGPEGRAVLMDFGLGTRSATVAAAGPFSGTPMFMSPQRLAGAPATPADDVYALGATLRFALSGTPPFAARSLETLREAASVDHADSWHALSADAPAVLVDAIRRAMSPRVEDRTASAAALASVFEALESATAVAGSAEVGIGDPASTSPPRQAASRAGVAPVTIERAPSWYGRRTGRWVIALAVAAFAVAVVVVLRTRSASTPGAARQSSVPGPFEPPPVASGVYDVGATFLRLGRDGDVRLASGDRIGPGDRLALEFHASRPLWVYVLDADDRRECYLLFPQPLFDLANPLSADSALRLPGTRGGREHAWTVTSRGGREHLLVIASPERVPELEAELSRLPSPIPGRPVQYARLGSATVEQLRGIGSVSEVAPPPSTPGPAAVFDRIRALAGRERGVRGVWMRQITLENPLR